MIYSGNKLELWAIRNLNKVQTTPVGIVIVSVGNSKRHTHNTSNTIMFIIMLNVIILTHSKGKVMSSVRVIYK